MFPQSCHNGAFAGLLAKTLPIHLLFPPALMFGTPVPCRHLVVPMHMSLVASSPDALPYPTNGSTVRSAANNGVGMNFTLLPSFWRSNCMPHMQFHNATEKRCALCTVRRAKCLTFWLSAHVLARRSARLNMAASV